MCEVMDVLIGWGDFFHNAYICGIIMLCALRFLQSYLSVTPPHPHKAEGKKN